MTMYLNVSISTDDIGGGAYDDGEFLAAIVNDVGRRLVADGDGKFRDRVIKDFIAELDDEGNAALRQLLSALDGEGC